MLATPSWTPFHTTRPKLRPFIISSSKFQRSRRRPPPRTNNLEEEEEEFGSMGRILVTSIKSNPSRRTEPVQLQPNPNSRSGNKEKKEDSSERRETEVALSGSDVLWALQRVAKEKTRNRSKRKKKVGRKSEGEGRDEERVDYGDVKELNVKSDWEVRLNDLENRLQQLLQSF